MAQSFTVTESLANLGRLTFTDTSTGLVGVTSRLIYIQLWDGTYLVPDGTTTDFIIWPAADSTKTIDVLDRSQAANITVRWLSGSTAAYTLTEEYAFPFFDYVFAFNKIRAQTANPNIVDSKNFYTSSIQFIVNLWNAETAVEIGADIQASQVSFDKNYFLIQNPQLYK